MQDSASFWADIKKLEEQLSKAPDSFCFAALSTVYLKAGLIDDALHVARQGVAKHPDYLSGQRALSLACHAKGLDDEALAALTRITLAVPEDVPSQKLLGRLLVEAGDQDGAVRVFRTALEFSPEDVECRIQLESLERSARASEFDTVCDEGDEGDEGDEDVIEDLELLEELDILDEEQPEAEAYVQEAAHDPLSTGTLADLYVKQGFIHKALEIYRTILADNPRDQATVARIAELEALDTGSAECAAECEDTFEDEIESISGFSTPAVESYQEAVSIQTPAHDVPPLPETLHTVADVFPVECNTPPELPVRGTADDALATLDGWLDNIRRIKSCR